MEATRRGTPKTGITFALAKNLFTTADHRTVAQVAEVATKAITAA